MHDADDVVDVLLVDGEPGVPRLGCGIEHTCDGRVGRDGDQVDARGHRGAGDDVAQLERCGEEPRVLDPDRAALARLTEHEQQLLRAVSELTLIDDLDAHDAREHVRHTVEQHDDRTQDTHVQRERSGDGQRDLLRAGDGEVLRRHLADHHVEEDDDGERDRHGDRDAGALRQVGDGECRLERVGDGRLGDRTEPERRERDPELRTGEGDGQLAQRLQRRDGAGLAGLRALLDDPSSGRQQRDLDRDEERVEAEEHDTDDERPQAHDGSPARRTSTSVTRRPSRRVTTISSPPWTDPSPTSGTRPSSAISSPATVS